METTRDPKPIILSLTGGFFLALTFPPFELDFFAWFALVPLLYAIDGKNPLQTLLYGFICGMAFYLVGLSWVTNTLVNFGKIPPALSWLVLGLLAAYLSFYISLFCFLLQRLSRNNPVFAFLLSPLIWTCLEYARSSYPELGFSWLGLGYSQVDRLAVIQIAEFTGVYGVSAWIVFVNTGLFYIFRGLYSKEPIAKFSLRIGFVLFCVSGFCLGFGFYTLERSASSENQTVKVGLVQGNIEQHLKWDRSYRHKVIDIYRRLTREAAKSQPDIIVWPEAVTPFYFSLDVMESRKVIDIVRSSGSAFLLGSPFLVYQEGKPSLVNSAFFISPEGEIMGRYDKMHLVPFGEFVPFEKVLWFVKKLASGVSDFHKGDEPKVFTLPLGKGRQARFGVSICFEITFPNLVRQSVNGGARFLINITNDAWFGKSAASSQHMDMAAMRAVENRTPIVRAANTGISGMIDATGRIRQTTDLFVEAVLPVNIQPRAAPLTFYSRFGDVFSFACIAGMIFLAILARRSGQ